MHSIEKNTGNVFFCLSAILGLIASYTVYLRFTAPSTHSGIWVAFFAFGIFSLLFYVLGKHFKRVYERLGHTVLFVEQNELILGSRFSGYITIDNMPNAKIESVKLTNKLYKGGHNNNHFKTLADFEYPCVYEKQGGGLRLSFDFEIPLDARPTERVNQNSYFWELSCEYRDKLDIIKRTWSVNIKR